MQMQKDEQEFILRKYQKYRVELEEADVFATNLKKKITKLEAQKSRLEDVLKASMKGNGKGDMMDTI